LEPSRHANRTDSSARSILVDEPGKSFGLWPDKYAGPAADAALAAVTGQIPDDANVGTAVNYANPNAVRAQGRTNWATNIDTNPAFESVGNFPRSQTTYFGSADQSRAPARPGITPGGLASVHQAIDNIGIPMNAAIAAALGVPQHIADAMSAAFGPSGYGFASLPASVQSALHAAFGN
jgi:hypothetical protein